MIYAKVDVQLRDHARAHKAADAMSTWLWGLLYSRGQESDGYIPDVAIKGAWVGEKAAKQHAKTLVSVGLWERDLDGWRISRYEAKNETAARIAERRAESRERMARVRANKPRTQSEVRNNRTHVNSAAVPDSDSVSLSGSDLGSRESTDGATPPWFEQAAAAAAMAVGGEVGELPARWVSYKASRDRKGWSMNHGDAVGWLSDVVRGERERAARAGPAPRQKLGAAANAPWMKPQPFDFGEGK